MLQNFFDHVSSFFYRFTSRYGNARNQIKIIWRKLKFCYENVMARYV